MKRSTASGNGVSVHQYYEFGAVDRLPSPAEQSELRAISSRAQITASGFVNFYDWGDFTGDPDRSMARSFDQDAGKRPGGGIGRPVGKDCL
jgi:hypothetical protein